MTKPTEQDLKEPKRIVVSDEMVEMIFFTRILREFMPQLELIVKKEDNK